MKKHEDATDYFNRVRRRELGGETFDGNGNVTFRGPPTREPRNGRVIVHNRVAHTLSPSRLADTS